MRQILVYDTTLRDGMQGIEISYTLEDKLQIAHKLDEMKIDYIEGGFPLSNEKESNFFTQIKNETFQHAKLVAFGSTRKPGGKVESDPQINALLGAETEAVTVVGKTWKPHITKVLKTNIEENLAMIHDSVSYLKKIGRTVFFDLEHFFDGFKDDPDYAIRVLRTGTEAGADCLILCDTNGGTLPHEVTDIMGRLPASELAPLGVHFHDDCGTAVANTLAGILAGASQIQGTVNGWGERCGNANLCVLIPNLCLKTTYTVSAAEKLDQMTSLSRFVFEKANIIPDKRQPYVGEAAFSHKAGQHADVIFKAPELMEHVNGERVGNQRRIVLSELAGRSTIVKRLAKYGNFDKNSEVVSRILETLKGRESEGYEYEAAEASFDLLVRKELKQYKPLIELNNYHLESYKAGGTPSKTVGRMFLLCKGRQLMGAGVGLGPVETLDKALRDALLPIYPFIADISLTDYRVRVLNPQAGAASKVRVFVTTSDKNRSWDTVGVSENVIEASWEATIESFEYFYNNFVL